MTTNFLDPIFYDVSDIPEDAPNKPLLRELYERENAQNERLWMFFTEMVESADYKPTIPHMRDGALRYSKSTYHPLVQPLSI